MEEENQVQINLDSEYKIAKKKTLLVRKLTQLREKADTEEV